MLKGCRKQMIVLHGTGSEIFEEAYFVLRKTDKVPVSARAVNAPETTHSDDELLFEANRILEASRVGEGKGLRRNHALRCAVFFAVGIMVGAGLILAALALT